MLPSHPRRLWRSAFTAVSAAMLAAVNQQWRLDRT